MPVSKFKMINVLDYPLTFKTKKNLFIRDSLLMHQPNHNAPQVLFSKVHLKYKFIIVNNSIHDESCIKYDIQ